MKVQSAGSGVGHGRSGAPMSSSVNESLSSPLNRSDAWRTIGEEMSSPTVTASSGSLATRVAG